MRLSRKDKKEALHEAAKQNALQAFLKNEAMKEQAKDESKLKESSEQDEIEERQEELAEYMSFREVLRAITGYIFIAAVFNIIAGLIVGFEYTIPMFLVAIIIMNSVIGRLYTPQYITVVEIAAPDTASLNWNIYRFPPYIFTKLVRKNMVNQIVTNQYGPAYLATEVVWKGNVPVAIEFAWIHFPEHNFVGKKEVYNSMKIYLNRLLKIDFKLQELFTLEVAAATKEATRERFNLMNIGKNQEVSRVLAEEAKIMEDIRQEFRINDHIERDSARRDEHGDTIEPVSYSE